MQKTSSTKQVYIVGDIIVKHASRYDISRKLKTLKYLSVPPMVQQLDHMKSVSRDNTDPIVIPIGNNDVSSNKTPETIAKSILDLATSSKSTTCDISLSNILTKKDKHQQKAQEINSYLKELCKEFNIRHIDYEKSIKPQHLNKSRLHLNKRGTSILLINFMLEISILYQYQCILRSPSGEFDAFSAEYKSKGNDINHLKLMHKVNLNKLAVAHLNISSIRNKFTNGMLVDQ